MRKNTNKANKYTRLDTYDKDDIFESSRTNKSKTRFKPLSINKARRAKKRTKYQTVFD